MDIGWFGLALAASARFMSVYAIRVGASPTELGLLASLPSLVLLFASALAVRWRRRYPSSTRAVFWPAFGFRLSFLLPVFTPFFPHEWQPVWLILSVTIPALPQGVGSIIFLIMMREAVHDQAMTALVSRRALAMNISVALGAVAFGFWLERVAFPLNYQLMFLFAFVITLVSLWHVNRVRPMIAPVIDAVNHPSVPRIPWRDPAFRRVAFITAIMHIGFFSVFPLMPLYLVDGLGANEGFMALISLAELAAAASVASIACRIVARIGNRSTIALGMSGTALGAFSIALAPGLYYTVPAALLTGASWTLAGIGLFGYFTEHSPKEENSRYTTAYMQVVASSMFVAPLIGSALAENGIELVYVLLIGAGLRLLAALFTDMNGVTHRFRWETLRPHFRGYGA